MLAHLTLLCLLALNINELHGCNSKVDTTSGSCGTKSSSDILSKIVNGNNAVPNSRPWLVSLQMKVNGIMTHNCGGSLINERYVLTAAHWIEPVRNLNDLTVVVGLHCLNKISNNQVYQVEKIIMHPNYQGAEKFVLGSDIGLIKLKNAVTLSSTVSLISLPSKNDVNNVIGKTVTVSGWGSISGVTPIAPTELKETSLKVNDGDSKCTENSNLFAGFNKESFYCLYDDSNRNSNVCPGDSGSPFIYNSNGKWYVYGVVSWVIKNLYYSPVCDPTRPSFFTRVPVFVDWINQNMV